MEEVERSSHDFNEARTKVWHHMLVYIDSISLKCVVELGVPDAIHNHGGPMTLSELVQALPIPTSRAPFLQRVMRVLVNSGFFIAIKRNEGLDINGSNEEEVYDLTATSKLLIKGSTSSLAPLVLFLTGLESAMAGQAMSAWINSSDDDDDEKETPFHVAHGGKGLFELASERPEFNALLNEAMACDSRVFMREVVKEWGDVLFGGLRSLVDVGGGTGCAAAVIAGAFPEVKCLVLDLAHVVDAQRENGLVEFVKGDMFVHVPHSDAFLLKYVLHNWDDEDCVKILRNCKNSISGSKGNRGKVIIIDAIMPPNSINQDTMQKTQCLFDVYMLTMTPGKERNAVEWIALFNKAGFSRFKIIGELGIHSILEIYP